MTAPSDELPSGTPPEVSQWFAARSRVLDTDPNVSAAELSDAVRDADIVGVAMGLRTGHESLLAAHAIVHTLVRAGFRAIALEGTTSTGEQLNRWVTTGQGDPSAMLAGSQAFLHNAETLEFLHWLRAHNLSRPEDPAQLVHSERAATPTSPDEIETQLATTDLRWRERTGQRVVHLGGIAHLVAGGLRTVEPFGAVGRAAGALIEDEVAYACVAVTIGTAGGSLRIPAPPANYFEHSLSDLPAERPLVDLRASTSEDDAPPEVRRWLSRPLLTRCVGPDYDPARDPEFFVRASPIASSIAAVAHIDTVTAAQPLPSGASDEPPH